MNMFRVLDCISELDSSIFILMLLKMPQYCLKSIRECSKYMAGKKFIIDDDG